MIFFELGTLDSRVIVVVHAAHPIMLLPPSTCWLPLRGRGRHISLAPPQHSAAAFATTCKLRTISCVLAMRLSLPERRESTALGQVSSEKFLACFHFSPRNISLSWPPSRSRLLRAMVMMISPSKMSYGTPTPTASATWCWSASCPPTTRPSSSGSTPGHSRYRVLSAALNSGRNTSRKYYVSRRSLRLSEVFVAKSARVPQTYAVSYRPGLGASRASRASRHFEGRNYLPLSDVALACRSLSSAPEKPQEDRKAACSISLDLN